MTEAQLVLDLGFRPALGRDDFLVAPCNAAAVGWVDRWPDWPGVGLSLWGGSGSGKTHLAEVWRAMSSADKFALSQLVEAELDDLLGRPGNTTVDLGEATLPPEAERPLLHLHNRLRDLGHSLLLISRTPPARWDVVLPDLRSRLNALVAVQIEAPDDALLGGLLVKLFADRQLRVGPDVIRYALRRMERSFSAARRLVDMVDREALVAGRAITVPLVRKALSAYGSYTGA